MGAACCEAGEFIAKDGDATSYVVCAATRQPQEKRNRRISKQAASPPTLGQLITKDHTPDDWRQVKIREKYLQTMDGKPAQKIVASQ